MDENRDIATFYDVLQLIREKYGEDIVFSPKRLKALLSDLNPQFKDEEKRLMYLIAENQTFIHNVYQQQSVSVDSISREVENLCGFSKRWSLIVTQSLLIVTGKIDSSQSLVTGITTVEESEEAFPRESSDSVHNKTISTPEIASDDGCEELLEQLEAADDIDYFFEDMSESDQKEAFARLQCLATQGNAAAQYYIGYMYNYGFGTEENKSEALKWYLLAADQQNADACASVGYMYKEGRGDLGKDASKALEWYIRAVDLGETEVAAHYIGEIYKEKKDYAEAMKWYERAGDSFWVDSLKKDIDKREREKRAKRIRIALVCVAIAAIGCVLFFLSGTDSWVHWGIQSSDTDSASPENTKERELPSNYAKLRSKEIDHYQKTADEGDYVSQYVIGVLYLYGITYDKDYEKAYDYFSKSAAQGYPNAYVSLGDMYYAGTGVDKDVTIALEWYQKAADLDDPDGLCNVGIAYYYGDGCEQSYEKAVESFNKAVDFGNDLAHLYLGYCYYNGYGVDTDGTKAEREFKDAANANVELAYYALLQYYLEMDKYDQAFHWAQKSADAKSERIREQGKYYLGLFYELGKVVEKDLEKAKAFFQEAQEIGGNDYTEDISRVEKEMEE